MKKFQFDLSTDYLDSYKGKLYDLLTVYFLLCVSGNTMWSLGNDVKHIYLVAFVLSGLFCWYKGAIAMKQAIGYILFWILLFCVQAPLCPYFNLTSTLFYIIKISIAAFIICAVGRRFCDVYFQIMYLLCGVSLIFFTFNCCGVWFSPLSQAFDRNSFFIHTQLVGSHGGDPVLRNCGMFWEPGAFQGYIILAFLPYFSKLKELFLFRRKQVIVMLITLFTTFSTTGFICVFALLILYLLAIGQLKVPRLLFLLFFCGIFTSIILGVDSVSDKLGITGTAADSVEGIIGGSRMYHASVFLPKAADYPFWGHGFSNEAINAANFATGSGNGFAALIYFGGLIFTISYFCLIFQAVRKAVNDKTAYCFVLIVLLLLQGEGYLGYPLFWGIPLLSAAIKYSNSKLQL